MHTFTAPVLQRRFWKALSAALIILLATGLLLAVPASAQTSVAEAELVEESQGGAVPTASPESQRQEASGVRVPSVEEVPALGRTISVRLTEAPLEEALTRIAAKGDVNVSYLQETVAGGEAVTLSLEAISTREALAAALRGTGLQLKRAGGDQLVLVSRPAPRAAQPSPAAAQDLDAAVKGLSLQAASATSAGNPAQQQGTIAGTVTDAGSGNPLPGVNVVVEGTQQGAATAADGTYEITGVEVGTHAVTATFVGYADTTRQGVEVQANQTTTVDFALEREAAALEEMVVVGYGTQQRRDLTGSVEVVNTANLQKIPEPQITDQLQGMASGVNVISSGQPGQNPQIRIRGINTFGDNSPLFVVDGVPTQSISNLNPSNIESLQVLKDASAATIYGARASNGVIIIETKQGEDDLSVQVNSYVGISKQPDESNPWEKLAPQGRADLEWMVFRNAGQEPTHPQYGSGEEPRLPDYILPAGAMEGDPGTDPSNYFVNPFYTDPSQAAQFNQIVRANKQGTDWFDELMRTAPTTDTDVTVSGGGEQGSYLFSLGYLNQQGTMRQTFLERYSLRTNTSYNVTDNITVGENLSYTVEENRLAALLERNTALSMAMRFRPIIPVRDIKGNWAGTRGAGLGNAESPVSLQERTRNDRNVDKRLFGNAFLEVTFLEDFRFRSTFGGSLTSAFEKDFEFPGYENSENSTINSLGESATNNQEWTFSNTLNYNQTFAQDHEVSVLAGVEWQKTNTRFAEASVRGFFSFDPQFTNLGNGSGTRDVDSQTRVTSLSSQFGKVDYNYKGRYFLSGTLRRDGSSKFLNDRFGLFPAASVGWRISEEPFMDGVFPWLANLKFRGGWGVMGNQLNVNPNNAFTLFGQRNFAYDITGSNSETAVGFVKSQIGAPDAQWEKDQNLNIGVDIAVLEGQLEAMVDYYRKDITDLLFNPERLAPAGRANAPFINVASMKNTGIDASIQGEIEAGGVQIQGGLNFTTYNNEITGVSEGFDSFSEETRRFATPIIRNEVGQEMSSYYGYEIVGFWQSEDEIQQANAQAPQGTTTYQTGAAPGRFRYKDVNGDGQITAEDRTFLGSPNPDFTTGINLNFAYSNWDLGLSLYGSQGAELWNHVKWYTDFFSSFNGGKAKVALNDSWTPDNRDATAPIQEPERSFSTNQVPNSYFVEDGSYLRIQNLQLGYTLPDQLVQRLGAESLRVYVQASNLYTFTGYSNPDPEVGGRNSGDVTSFGIDNGAYPTPRKFLGGVNLTF